MTAIAIKTNIGIVHVKIISQKPIIGTDMLTNRNAIVIETATKRYCAVLSDELENVSHVNINRRSDGKMESYVSNKIKHSNQFEMIRRLSKHEPSIITFNDEFMIPVINIHFACFSHSDLDPNTFISFDSYKQSLNTFQVTAFEYDDQSNETNFDNKKFSDMVKKIIMIEEGKEKLEKKTQHTLLPNTPPQYDDVFPGSTFNDIDNICDVLYNLKKEYDELVNENKRLREENSILRQNMMT